MLGVTGIFWAGKTVAVFAGVYAGLVNADVPRALRYDAPVALVYLQAVRVG